jgi:phosphatidylserine decarboxylase
MKSISRDGKTIYPENLQDHVIGILYGSVVFRAIMRFLAKSSISKCSGAFMDSKASTILIQPFIKLNHIDMQPYVRKKYTSFNDFFTRKIQPQARPIDSDDTNLISPADGRISVYKIKKNSFFQIKHTKYSLESILQDANLAKEYMGGYFVIVRLSVDNYHRYCNIDNGNILKYKEIPGVFHTVNPIANSYFKIYKENSRAYTVIDTEQFDKVIQMEVGALLVGRIVNEQTSGMVYRGSEKGKFEYGGSTVVLVLKKDAVKIDKDLIINTQRGYETHVKMGEHIGKKQTDYV